MKKVPNIISTKDLSYISDAYQWNFTIAKKALAYSKQVSDKQINSKMKEVFKLHRNICSSLIDLLG